jgi:hypothetical protein
MGIRPPKGKKPYDGTTVSVEQSKSQVTTLLRQYGAEGVAWTDNFQTGQVNLRFVVSRDDGRTTQYSITPPPFKEKHQQWNAKLGRREIVEAPNWPRAMRLLHSWLKSKLESIAFGLTEVEQEFLAQMVVRDATGRETTAGELVLEAIETGDGRLALNAPRDRANALDADARVVT